MKIMFIGIAVLLLVSGCSTLDASNHEDYGTASPPAMYIHPDQSLEPQEEEEVQIHVLQNEQPYALEDEVTLTVYHKDREQMQKMTAEAVREGVYTATIRVPDDGVYTLEAAAGQNEAGLRTAKQIGIGELTSDEQSMLADEEAMNHDHSHH
ncbi:hypothetical protein [Marinococcus sp. PL1-022]|uniref:hypothetical protein n=1 Tax=Marinococcus sp. PL1-022 TaxID=3095363 RepID=UPI0029C3DE58|nr:hypothetical protein [Marinococcus sp. PL1-022]MDX6152654.1 hypothetical protein [Marinococcus sp. PL1-022]